jgi:hypothetical protein
MLDKEILLKPRLLDEPLELLTGGEIRVRGLSRTEVRELRRLPDVDFEPALVAKGVVEPELTVEEARIWSDVSPAEEIEQVVRKISDLSGMGANSPKEAYKSLRQQSDA